MEKWGEDGEHSRPKEQQVQRAWGGTKLEEFPEQKKGPVMGMQGVREGSGGEVGRGAATATKPLPTISYYPHPPNSGATAWL